MAEDIARVPVAVSGRLSRKAGTMPVHKARAGALLIFATILAGCGIQPDPPPDIPLSAYGGMGDVMAKCMQYASESYCYRNTWGSDEQ
jgi:hypothetical protein